MRPLLFIALLLPAAASAKPEPAREVSRSEKLTALRAPEGEKEMEFNMKQLVRGGTEVKTFYTRGAKVDSFYYQQKFKAQAYDTPEYKSKSFLGRLFSFGTKKADTKTFATKSMATKTAATKEAYDSGKTAATKSLHDGDRPYLGPESKLLHKPLDPTNLPKITNAGRELKTVEDIKDLLNKN